MSIDGNDDESIACRKRVKWDSFSILLVTSLLFLFVFISARPSSYVRFLFVFLIRIVWHWGFTLGKSQFGRRVIVQLIPWKCDNWISFNLFEMDFFVGNVSRPYRWAFHTLKNVTEKMKIEKSGKKWKSSLLFSLFFGRSFRFVYAISKVNHCSLFSALTSSQSLYFPLVLDYNTIKFNLIIDRLFGLGARHRKMTKEIRHLSSDFSIFVVSKVVENVSMNRSWTYFVW